MPSEKETMSELRPKIGPSLLASDMSQLANEAKRVLSAGADYLHLDVMDGHFVPNLTFGAPIIKSLRENVPNAIFDVHMMVSEPGKWVGDMADAGVDVLTFHIEATDSPEELIKEIKARNIKVGVAVKPNTSIDDVIPFANDVDAILVMTVEPGFGGQSFMPDMMSKVRQLRSAFPTLEIQVDGGLGPSTIDVAAAAGANSIVAGSAVFKSDDPGEVIRVLRSSVERNLVAETETA